MVVVGVPLITPAEDSDKPGGSVPIPETIVQVYVVPPVAVSGGAEYATFNLAGGSGELVVIVIVAA